MATTQYELLGPVGPPPTMEIPKDYVTKWPIVIRQGLGFPKPIPNEWPNLARYLTPKIVEVFFDADDPDPEADSTAIIEEDQWEKIRHLNLQVDSHGPRKNDGSFARRLGALVPDPVTGILKFESVDQLLHDKTIPFKEKRHRNRNPFDFQRSNIKPEYVPDPKRKSFLKHFIKKPRQPYLENGVVLYGVREKDGRKLYCRATWMEDGEVKFGQIFDYNLADSQAKAAAEWKSNMDRLFEADLAAAVEAAKPKRKVNSFTSNAPKKMKILPPPWDFPGFGDIEDGFDWDPLFPNPVRPIARGVVELAFDKKKTQTMIMDIESWKLIHADEWRVQHNAKPRTDGSSDIKIFKWIKVEDEPKRMQQRLTDVISDFHSSYAPPRHLNGNLFDFRLENLARGLKEHSGFNPDLKSGWQGIEKVDGPGVERPYFRAIWMDDYGVYQKGALFNFLPGDGESEYNAVSQALKERFTSMPAVRLQRANKK